MCIVILGKDKDKMLIGKIVKKGVKECFKFFNSFLLFPNF